MDIEKRDEGSVTTMSRADVCGFLFIDKIVINLRVCECMSSNKIGIAAVLECYYGTIDDDDIWWWFGGGGMDLWRVE